MYTFQKGTANINVRPQDTETKHKIGPLKIYFIFVRIYPLHVLIFGCVCGGVCMLIYPLHVLIFGCMCVGVCMHVSKGKLVLSFYCMCPREGT